MSIQSSSAIQLARKPFMPVDPFLYANPSPFPPSSQNGKRGRVAALCGHIDPVNHHKFVDHNLLLTASDDTSVLLWDLRCVGGGRDGAVGWRAGVGSWGGGGRGPEGSKALVNSFCGHSNWVKNIEVVMFVNLKPTIISAGSCASLRSCTFRLLSLNLPPSLSLSAVSLRAYMHTRLNSSRP